MPITVRDNRLNDLVASDAEPEKIASGYQFTEGPVWHSRDESLIFSDVRGGAMYRWTERGGATVFRQASGVGNGNTYDPQMRLLTCEHEGRRVSRTAADGTVETLVSHYQGKRLSSPNDVICTRSGDVIFTDPPYGLRRPDGTFGPQEIPFNGVFRLSASGELKVLVEDFERPNGLVLSQDGARLFIADTAHEHVRVFDVGSDGSLSNGRIFVEGFQAQVGGAATARPDGMKLDSLGNLYVAANTAEGVWVFSPQGELLGNIALPETPANLAWGGAGWRTLFVTATTSVYRLPMKVAGQAVPIA
jgi:sugar lactone lactonase YvrE